MTDLQLLPKEARDFLSGYLNEHTRAAYTFSLIDFSRWCIKNNVKIIEATRTDINLFLASLRVRNLAQATIAAKFGALEQFYKYLVDEDILIRPPTQKISYPKVDKDAQRRTWLDTGEFHRLVAIAKTEGRIVDKAIILLMATTGMRVGELCGLDVEDVHLDAGKVYVEYFRKGGKITRPNISLDTYFLIKEMCAGRTTGPLFINNYGNRMTRTGVSRILRRLAKVAGITKEISPHSLRRSFAITADRLGMSHTEIQRALFHADPRTTQLYLMNNNAGTVARAAVSEFLSG